jgi:hypothetical protein|tara:strand:- start:4 stop:228 length:225 start_codon:yes stop_codon:yes gene_type:complete
MRIKSLNDGTTGFRFDIAGVQGLYRKRDVRKAKALNGKFMGITRGDCMTGFHLGKRSLYLEGGMYRRMLHNFAG